ncbi:hypothetical protein LIA77_08061 [Sarocladium implicatum]|nr:hypothetical protein LIA77_08061 [Sarocladium implicatum]
MGFLSQCSPYDPQLENWMLLCALGIEIGPVGPQEPVLINEGFRAWSRTSTGPAGVRNRATPRIKSRQRQPQAAA